MMRAGGVVAQEEAPVTEVTFTQNLVTESNAGHDGPVSWQSVYLLNDGTIASFGTGNHAPNQSNAMRIIDVSDPDNVTTSNAFTWDQEAASPFWTREAIEGVDTPYPQVGNVAGLNGFNQKATNFDNHASIYLPWANKTIWFGHGVFDHEVNDWTYGNRSPNTDTYDDFIDVSARPGFDQAYNPSVAICTALRIGVLFGNSGGGSGNEFDTLLTVEDNPAGPEPYKIVATGMSAEGVAELCYGRNSSVCVGHFLYLGGLLGNSSGVPIGGNAFYKIDLRDKTLVEELTPPSFVTDSGPGADDGDAFPQLVYDVDRQKFVNIGIALQEYDIATDTWTDITPDGWPGYRHPMGVYHWINKKIYFRGIPQPTVGGTGSQNFNWHSLEFPQAGFTRWREIDIDPDFSPFQGPPEEAFGGSKHVRFAEYPPNGRLYTFGGDYGNGASAFSQPNMGSSFTTNEPTGANSFDRDSSLCNDMYSIDPLASGLVPFRLEHPYKVRDLGSGTREDRPGRPDQASLVWDPVDEKFWCLYSVLRTEFLYLDTGVPDLWANGTTTTTGTIEPPYTFSWLPGAGGTNGTFTRELDYNLVHRSGSTSYSGDTLISGLGDERIGQFEYDALNDCMACLSAAVGSTQALFTFHPRAGVGVKKYQYRTFSTSGYSRMDCSGSYTAVVDGVAYAVAIATTSGGTRKSVLLKVDITAALAEANEGTVPSGAIEVIDLPWSLSPGNVWEDSGDASAKWQEHGGVNAIDRKVVILKSYDGIVEDGETKGAIYDPDTGVLTAIEDAPENVYANAWCCVSATGEVFMGMNTSGTYSNNKAWALRVR
jgi:hypothetical protein